MRLWHKELISVLPRAQLVAQWRELSAIVSNIKTKNTPNHILVNKIMDYSYDHFITYAKLVREEMNRRGYQTRNNVWEKIISIKLDWKEIEFDKLYLNWMDRQYLNICYYNLLEKYLFGGIEEKDWQKILKKCGY